ARPGAAGVHRVPRPAVRVLHPRDADDRPGTAGHQPGSVRRRDPRSPLRAAVPLYRVREHRARGPLGRRAPGRDGGNDVTVTQERATVGFGRTLRKEDARFVRGKGTYVDDVVLPGMLHGAMLRSPYAHARIVSIDTSQALAHPKVKAVITGETLQGLNLAWMPTLSYDTQAVLATDKVRFQGQEVAFVIAEDHYSARDALELIEVEYEPLPPVVDAKRALDPDAPVIRDDKEGKRDNHIFDWEAGDKAAADAIF